MPASQNLVRLKVRGLFGRFDMISRSLVSIPIAILTAPNGYGKTHLLHMIDAVARQDYQEPSRYTFDSLEIVADQSQMTVTRKQEGFGNLPDGTVGTVTQLRAGTAGQRGRTPSMGSSLGE